jgi:two-component SAPR family response regulator
MEGIIKRFKKNNSPALSLFIAKKYYEAEDYHNAYNYALITNNINREIESSWIIFSKSLVKLGKKELAIKTLQEYTGQSKSRSAKILLDEIQTGKFK